MEPFIFCVRDCYYIRASYPSPAEHRHFAAHLVFAMERPFTALVDGKSVETVGIAIGSDVPHTILSVDPALVVFIDELTPMSRCVKHTLLQGAPWRALDASVSSRGGKGWGGVRTGAGSAAGRPLMRRGGNPPRWRGARGGALEGSVCPGVGRRGGGVRPERGAPTAAAETERLLGLQAEHAPAEDPRVLEAAAYMKSAPALEQLTIRNVARAVHLSPSRLTHLFRRDTGISPSLYLANLKLERAFYLLDTGPSLTQVCMDAGFATPSHMADTSRKLYGMSMTEVKQIFLNGLGQNSR